jgi:hypothetical protein
VKFFVEIGFSSWDWEIINLRVCDRSHEAKSELGSIPGNVDLKIDDLSAIALKKE